VQLSARARYAITAMADLAARGDSGPVALVQIAARQRISQCYLEQLFGALRRNGLVVSSRGPGGGYRLARPAERIFISDIVTAMDELICVVEPGPAGCPALEALWSQLAAHIQGFFARITLAELASLGGDAACPRAGASDLAVS
jgi:Rrf2 family iron-sulfur cluster assembly transcriptional regulator